MTTVVIPAHNEGRVIGRLLGQLLPSAPRSELDVIVVANGCTDDTAQVAASFGPRVRVLSIPVASKNEALAAAARAATGFPRVYVDADVELRAEDVRALVAALRQPGVLAAAPQRVLAAAGRPWPVRWYYDVWARLPEVQRGLWGRGVIAVDKPGQERVADLPPFLSDDLAVALLFAPHEQSIVADAHAVIHLPWTLADLLRRRVRHVAGAALVQRAEHAPGPAPRTRLSDLAAIARSEPRMLARVGLFLSVTVLIRLRAHRLAARGDNPGWPRDESSRRQ